MFANDGKHNRDIARRANVENKVNGALLAIMDGKSVSRPACLAIHNGVLIPSLMYGSESCNIWYSKTNRTTKSIWSLRNTCGVFLKDRCRAGDVREPVWFEVRRSD
ncbi:hypothetical protein EVAR_76787_1 [Eumeta japonica]|uniref:Uncharacterized protein n=1 Tax=Eumeta variegata TaxID=151549 RepID=A0A4C1STV5_EUMVA|nr:hypothetical protein EVAR_76787_1 [Eumeta japonica]